MSEYIDGQKRTSNCEKHGEYIETYLDIFKRFCGYCEKCTEEREVAQKEKSRLEHEEIIRSNKISLRRNAGISIRNIGKTFDDYICESGSKQELAKRKFMKLSDSMLNENGFNIIACGGVGTGKTLLASALIDSIVDKKRCKLITVMDLCRELKATWARDSEYTEKEVLRSYQDIDLLIIDEIGVQFGSETERLFIFDIINGRYDRINPTVLLSNLSIDLVREIVGERVIDRLRDDSGQLVVFDWESMRGKK